MVTKKILRNVLAIRIKNSYKLRDFLKAFSDWSFPKLKHLTEGLSQDVPISGNEASKSQCVDLLQTAGVTEVKDKAWEAASLPMKKGTVKLAFQNQLQWFESNGSEEEKKAGNEALGEISVAVVTEILGNYGSAQFSANTEKLKGITRGLRSCLILYLPTEMQYDDSP
ncbi:13972_t:CDS:2 [Funneliformis mosseae]|uniref:13972_t:CDS:1 n=1 Tax=Funneliformis mosseae TaxID=27381 RepID=A0A9N8WQ14_FUNMO|nr:13972_t:CDS:2 [Funneliformis mosseae]